MTLRDILDRKGTDVFSITPDSTLENVVSQLVECNCGSLVVRLNGNTSPLLGIITERDILLACETKKAAFGDITVSEAMSTDLHTGAPDDSLEKVMGMMTKNRVRHLPVVEDNQLIGLVSIGDVVKAKFDHLQHENHFLKTYIQSW